MTGHLAQWVGTVPDPHTNEKLILIILMEISILHSSSGQVYYTEQTSSTSLSCEYNALSWNLF